MRPWRCLVTAQHLAPPARSGQSLERGRRLGRRGAPVGLNVEESDEQLALAGDVMTMPGLPKVPSAEHIDIDEAGRIVGLS